MRILLLTLSLLLPLPAFAQPKGSLRTCRILFLSPPPDAPRKLHLFDGTTSREVHLPEMNFSEVHTLPAGNLTLYLLTTPLVAGEVIPAGAPSAKVQENVSDCYLVISGDPSNTVVPVRFQIIDAGHTRFPKGRMMWFNLSPKTIGGDVGSSKLVMKPNTRVLLDAPARGAEPYQVNLSYRLPDDPRYYPICQTQWIHDPRSRMVVFVIGTGGRSTPQVIGFNDFREAPEDNG
ncbi:MAG: hypothetical protein WEB53_15370 [Akkermansiaceae bacterium]